MDVPAAAAHEIESILDHFGLSVEEFSDLVRTNNSLRGILAGYAGEKHFRDEIIAGLAGVEDLGKPDDHDRRRKGDRTVSYKGESFRIEVKSLQSNSIRYDPVAGWRGKAQCDASDRRLVKLPNGDEVTTTCLVVGEWDVLACNLFAFGQGRHYAYIRNCDLPRSQWPAYTEVQQQYLLKTTIDVAFPIVEPFYADLAVLLDEMVEERQTARMLLQ